MKKEKFTTQELRKMVIEFTKEELESEIWLPIKDFEDYYEVSSLGRFRSKDRIITRYNGILEKKSARILKNNYYPNGYVQLILYVEKQRFNFIAHRVVSEHFIPNPNNLPVVNHLNSIKWDNRVVNMEWCTYKENSKHAFSNVTWERDTACGERHANSKLSNEEVKHIKDNYNPLTINKELFSLYKHKISKPTFNKIGKGQTWKHI
jgi:hypothetical protein